MFVWLTHLLSLYSSKPPRGMITRGKREGIFANPKGPLTSSTAFFHVFGRTSTVCGILFSDWLSFPKGCPATRAEGSETQSLEREGGSVALSQARTIWFVLATASERHCDIITPQPFFRNRSIYISQWSVDRAPKQSETESKMRASPEWARNVFPSPHKNHWLHKKMGRVNVTSPTGLRIPVRKHRDWFTVSARCAMVGACGPVLAQPLVGWLHSANKSTIVTPTT